MAKHCHLLFVAFCCMLTMANTAYSRGVSPYLPLQSAPEIEREVRRLFTMAGMPVLRKPWFAADVEAALKRACSPPDAICTRVQIYLDRYKRAAGFMDASALLKSADTPDKFTPNQRGMKLASRYNVSARAYWQAADYLLFTASAVAYEDEIVPTAIISIGFDAAQVDIGWRDRWFSPFQDSATMISTNALPSPSVTITLCPKVETSSTRKETTSFPASSIPIHTSR